MHKHKHCATCTCDAHLPPPRKCTQCRNAAFEEGELCYACVQLAQDEADIAELSAMACPGCGCLPGDGRTPGCAHPTGCGYGVQVAS